MVNPAAVVDVEARWRPLAGEEATNAQAFLDDAWVMLKRRISTLEADVLTDADLSADVVRIECQMVLRVLKNPDGKRQEAIDDYSWTRDESVSGGLLYVTDAELDELSPGKTTAAFTIRQVAVPFCGPSASPSGDVEIYGLPYSGVVYR